MSEPAWTKVPIKTAANKSQEKTLKSPNWNSTASLDADPNECDFTMSDLVNVSAVVQNKENSEGKISESFEPERVCAVLNGKGKLGSVYTAVARKLAKQGGWKRKKSSSGRFHMILGEAGGTGIPFKRFSQVFRYDYGIKPLVNYNRNCKSLTDKVMLTQTLQHGKHEHTFACEPFLPETYLFWPGREDISQTKKLEKAFNESQDENTWIVKPSNESHGNGIFLSDSLEEILQHFQNQPDGSKPWLVQRYVQNPMLIDESRKCDIRVWVLLTHDFKVYVHRDGVVRTSSVSFSMKNLRDKFIHLTNHSIQQEHSDFGKFEESNEIFFPEFESRLQKSNGISFYKDIMPQINLCVKETFVAAKPILEGIDEIDDYHSFMFFGFDFVVDDSAKVWLLEVNATPAISQSLQSKIAGDIIKTAIDPVFPRVQSDTKDGDSEFDLVYASEGRCDFVANMPAPDSYEDVEIETFGMSGKGSKHSKK